MAVFESLVSPISIAFTVIILGYFLGKIKICRVSLDLSGVLIISVVCGWIFYQFEYTSTFLITPEFQENMRFFSSFGTALFVSVIGISSGYSMDVRNRTDVKAILIGALMTVSAFVTMKTIILFDKDVSFSKMLGCLCGSLTTTPGLSAVNELKNVIAEEATLGYGCAYLFGVVAAVLFVQISTRKMDESLDNKIQEVNEDSQAALGGLIQIGMTVFVGQLIGSIRVFSFSLGNSGGILCLGIAVGMIIKTYFPKKMASKQILGHFKNLGLVLFFVGNGILAGMHLCTGFEVKIVMYGILMTMIPICFGVGLYKLLFKNGVSATVVAGGMTSTPAIGVLMKKQVDIPLNRYSLAYVGALMTIVFLVRL